MNTSNNPDNRPVLLGKHHDITAFASQDPGRYAIQSVHYDAARKLLKATNGMVLIEVPVCDKADEFPPVNASCRAESVTIPLAPFKKALGEAPRNGLPVLQHMRLAVKPPAGEDEQPSVQLSTHDLDTESTRTCKAVKDTYPDFEAAKPTEAPAFSIALPSSQLRKIAEYADKHGKPEGGQGCPIRFDFIDELSAVRFSFTLDDAMDEYPKATGVLMPMCNQERHQ